MGWIETIRSLLGLQSNGHRESGDVEVTVEKDPDASSERAVKEPTDGDVVVRDEPAEGDDEQLDEVEDDLEAASETGTDEDEPTEDTDESVSAVVEDAETDAAAEASVDQASVDEFAEDEGTEGVADDEPEVEADDEPEGQADDEPEVEADDEPEGQADEEPDAETADDSEAEPVDDSVTEESPSESAEAQELTDVKGIGSAYADRLRAAGVEDGADLAAADADDLSAETDISAKRLQRWIDRVSNR